MNQEDLAILSNALDYTRTNAEATINNVSKCKYLVQQNKLASISRKELEFIETSLHQYIEHCKLNEVDQVDKLSGIIHKMLRGNQTEQKTQVAIKPATESTQKRGPNDYTLQDLADKFFRWEWLDKKTAKLEKYRIEMERKQQADMDASHQTQGRNTQPSA